MESSVFLLSSMSILGVSFQFLIWMLSLFRVDMLGYVAIDGAPLYWTDFGVIYSGCLSPRPSLGGKAARVNWFE
jgi:hypothetical protein